MKKKLITIFLILVLISIAPVYAKTKCSTSYWPVHYSDMKVTKMDGDGNMEIRFDHHAYQESFTQCKHSLGGVLGVIAFLAVAFIPGAQAVVAGALGTSAAAAPIAAGAIGYVGGNALSSSPGASAPGTSSDPNANEGGLAIATS